MRQEVIDISRQAARRILWTRTTESAAVGAVAGGAASAVVQAALLAAGIAPRLAVAACLLLVASGFLPVWGAVRRTFRLGVPMSVLVAGLLAAGGLAGAWILLASRAASVPQAIIPAIALPAGAALCATATLVRGVSTGQAAVFLDRRMGLHEQLATAVELADSPHRDNPPARCVYVRALAAARTTLAGRPRLWTRTGRTGGAVLLAALFCTTLAVLPGPGEAGADLRQIAAGVEGMTVARRAELARALRAAAEAKDPALARVLQKAAAAAEKRDAEDLAGLLRELRQAGLEPVAIIPAEFLPDSLASGGTKGSGKTASGAGDGTTQPGTNPASAPAEDASRIPRYVRVYDPRYVRANPPPETPETVEAAEALVSFDLAWEAARQRAAERLSRGEVPPEYCRLVRDFFSPK